MASTRSRRTGPRLAALGLGLVLAVASVGAVVASRGGPGEKPGPQGGPEASEPSRDPGARGAEAPGAGTDTGNAGDAPSPSGPATDAGSAGGAGALGELAGEEVAASLAEGLGGMPAARTAREVGRDVPDAAAAELEAYEERGDVVLVQAGYLDLLGNTWGCVVAGPGWAEVCVVTRRAEGGSEVTRLRMEERRWEDAYAAELAGRGPS